MSAASATNHEFNFTSHDFERARSLIYKHAGISLGPAKQDMVYSRLAKRLRATGTDSFSDYLGRLERGDPEEMEAFVNSLTTHLTAFFREAHHFPILADHVAKQKHRPIEIWCSASSTGEEPYSLAMTMVDLFRSFTPPVRILATDVDTQVLAKAERGVYDLDRVQKMPTDKLRKFFLKGAGASAGQARARPELRALIHFKQINLLDKSWPIRAPFDAIFCRNVMIYFDKPTQYGILEKFVPLLRPEGLLFAGHSESFFHAANLFKSRGKTVFELANSALKAGAARNRPSHQPASIGQQ
ncbi:MAG: CheR family methyltransferase [Burkholderiales bacterium]